MHFRTNMVRFLIPTIEGKLTNDDSKWHRTIDRLSDWFFMDLASVLGATLEPCWPPFSAQNGPGGFQDASKTPPRRSKALSQTSRMAQDKTPPNLPQSPPDFDFGASRPGFWWLFADPFLDGFGIIFTMQIPSRLHVIEASKAFSKIEFLKELPICSFFN